MSSYSQLATSPNLTQLLKLAFEEGSADLHVALPAKVLEYDPGNQTAKVKPLVRDWRVTSQGEEFLEDVPEIFNVPVIFPRGGEFFFMFPLAPGDKVLLVFNDLSITNYNESDGEESDPEERHRHALDDAVAIPGFFPRSQAVQEADPSAITVGRVGGTPDAVALASLVEQRLAALEMAFNTHVHTSAAPMSPSSTPVTPPAVPLSVAGTPPVDSQTVKVSE